MSAKSGDVSNYETIINIVRKWPAPQRFTLVQEVLATLAPEVSAPLHRQPTLVRARGLLAIQQSAPSDQDVEAMLDERRRERYGL